MANTTIQLKRSSVAGKQPNTATLSIGELAINLTDKKLYSSDGSSIFEPAANVTNLNITGGIKANGSFGNNSQVLKSNGSVVFWADPATTTSAPLDTQDTHPTSPVDGQIYWNTALGKLLIYYNDGNTQQWVEAVNAPNIDVAGANNLAITDNMIYLNSNSVVSNPDLGFAGNYNDGTYRHAGFFRDATDGIWKVFDNYVPEPDASSFIDTSNNTFNIANFQANVIYVGNTTVFATINTTNFSGTSNNTSFVGTVSAANVVSNSQLSSNLTNYAALSGATFTGIVTLNANVIIGSSGISANGNFGTSGQVLTSNGSAAYWSTSGGGAESFINMMQGTI